MIPSYCPVCLKSLKLNDDYQNSSIFSNCSINLYESYIFTEITIIFNPYIELYITLIKNSSILKFIQQKASCLTLIHISLPLTCLNSITLNHSYDFSFYLPPYVTHPYLFPIAPLNWYVTIPIIDLSQKNKLTILYLLLTLLNIESIIIILHLNPLLELITTIITKLIWVKLS